MKRTVNFFQGMRSGAGDAKKLRDKKMTAFLVLLGVVFVALAAVTGVLFLQNGSLDSDLKALQDYTQDPVVQQKYEELTELQAETASLSSFVALGEAAIAAESGLVFDLDLYNRILLQKPDRVTLTNLSYDAASGVVLNCTTTDNMPPADFAQNLDTSGLFTAVKYSGFSASAEGNVVFQIVCE